MKCPGTELDGRGSVGTGWAGLMRSPVQVMFGRQRINYDQIQAAIVLEGDHNNYRSRDPTWSSKEGGTS